MHDMDYIYQEHAKMVFKFLYTKTHDYYLAEELTQETFYQAVKSIKSFKGECKISTWLCQIAKHVWLQDLEKKSKYQNVEITTDIPSPQISIDKYIIYKEQKIQIINALHKIKEPAREVCYLRLFGDLSFKEIADIFNQTETWARVTFYRAKEKIIKEVTNNE